MDDYKSSEVIFKYYLPDNQDELWIHSHAYEMYSLISEISEVCRSLIKYGDATIGTQYDLAEKIREMICTNIDLDKVR